MIIGNIASFERYTALHKNFRAGFDFIKKALKDGLEAGRHEIDGEAIYAMIQEYETREQTQKMLEGHKKYIDLQFIADGTERMEIIDIARAEVIKEYDSQLEAAFFAPKEECTSGIFSAGDFAIFFPEDLHQPGLRSAKDACHVKKIIVKIAI